MFFSLSDLKTSFDMDIMENLFMQQFGALNIQRIFLYKFLNDISEKIWLKLLIEFKMIFEGVKYLIKSALIVGGIDHYENLKEFLKIYFGINFILDFKIFKSSNHNRSPTN